MWSNARYIFCFNSVWNAITSLFHFGPVKAVNSQISFLFPILIACFQLHNVKLTFLEVFSHEIINLSITRLDSARDFTRRWIAAAASDDKLTRQTEDKSVRL